MVCGRRTRLSVTRRKLSGFEVITSVLIHFLVSIPLALILAPKGKSARFPLCLRHHLSHGFPGYVLPIIAIIHVLLLISAIVVLITVEQLLLGLLLAAASILWIFAVTTASHYAPHWDLPVSISISEGRFIYRVEPRSHFFSDKRI